jgi:hypothetical protein
MIRRIYEVHNLRGQSSITSSQGEQVRYGNSGVNGKVEWWEFSGANYVRIARLVPSLTVKDGEEPFMVVVNWLEMLRLPVRQH